jgi:hypothetical protein
LEPDHVFWLRPQSCRVGQPVFPADLLYALSGFPPVDGGFKAINP